MSSPAPIDFTGLNEEFQKRRALELRQNALAAPTSTPDRTAEASRLSEETGIPAPVVHRNFDEVKAKSDQAKMAAWMDTINKTNPQLASWLNRSPEHPSLVRDDLPHMGLFDSSLAVGKNFVRALAAGVESGVSGFWSAVQGGADVLREHITGPTWYTGDFEVDQVLSYYDPFLLASTVAERAATRTKEAADVLRGPQTGAGPMEKAVYGGAESIGQMLLTIPLSVATGSPTPALAGMGLMQGGQSYAQGREAGLSVDKAAAFGAI